MKANAPEKVYLHLTKGNHILNGKYYEYKPAKICFDDKIIEYTRTDAFIEKAKKWMLTHTYMFQSIEEVDLYIEMFIKEMKGE